MISLNKLNKIINYALIVGIFTLNSTIISSVLIFSLISFLLIINFRQIEINTLEKIILCLFLTPCIAVSFLFDFELVQFIRFLEIIVIIFLFPTTTFFLFKRRGLILTLILYIVFIQLSLAFNVDIVNSFVENNYPIPLELNNFNYGVYDSSSTLIDIISSRFGGYFHNPNILAANIYLLTCLYIGNITLYKDYNKSQLLIIILIAFISIFLSGSRTVLITFFITILFGLKKQIKSFLIPLSLMFGIFLFSSLSKLIQELSNARIFSNIFSLFSDKDDSGYSKYFGFYKYFRDYNYSDINELLALFFGKMGWNFQFDIDFGYLLSFFGVIGSAMILVYLMLLYNRSKSEMRFMFFIFLISIGATIIMNFRFCIIALHLISSTYNLKNKRTNLCVE